MTKSFFPELVYLGLVLAVMWLLGAGEHIRWSKMEVLREIFQRCPSAVRSVKSGSKNLPYCRPLFVSCRFPVGRFVSSELI